MVFTAPFRFAITFADASKRYAYTRLPSCACITEAGLRRAWSRCRLVAPTTDAEEALLAPRTPAVGHEYTALRSRPLPSRSA